MALLNYINKMKYLVVFILISLSSATLAITDAGTKIMNQAIMTYFDSESGETIKILSNISYIRVENVHDFELTPDTSGGKVEKYTAAGAVVNVSNIITNTGNTTDSYIINVNNLTGDNGDVTSPNSDDINVYIDTNGNGIYDAGEIELQKDNNGNYITPKLNQGEKINLVYVVSIPSNDLNNTIYDIETVVTSVTDPDVVKTSEMSIIVTTGPVVNLTASSSAICEQKLESFDNVEYRIDYTSIGLVQPQAAEQPYSFTINTGSMTSPDYKKVSYTGVLITSELPGNITLQQDKIINGEPARDYAPITISSPETKFDGGIVLVGINNSFKSNATNHDIDWFDYATWDGSGNVAKIGFLVKPTYLRPNTSGYFRYYAEVNDIAGAPAFEIYSQAQVNLSATDINISYSDEICNTLSGINDKTKTDSNDLLNFQELQVDVVNNDIDIIHHETSHFVNTDFYYHTETDNFSSKSDSIYIDVFLPQANQYPGAIDIIGPSSSDYPVLLSSNAQDKFHLVFAETGTNTGHFRSIIPVHPISPEEASSSNNLEHCLEGLVTTWETNHVDNTSLLSLIDGVINLSAHGLNGEDTYPECELEVMSGGEIYADVYDSVNGRLLLSDIAYISPQFTVFDATNFKGVADATVTFYKTVEGVAPDAKTRLPNTDGLTPEAQVISDADGRVFYPKLEINDLDKYYITVTPPTTHQWPSEYTDLDAFNLFKVSPESYGPFGNKDVVDSGTFELTPQKTINLFDIPIDPNNLDRRLSVQKTADKETAEIGSYIKYTVIVKNNLPDSEIFNAQVFDSMPYGFKYMPGSTRLNDQPFADPMRIDKYTYRFDIGTLSGSTQAPQNGTYTLTYVLQLTAGALDSDGINSVYAQARTFGGSSANQLVSNTDKYQVRITQTGVMSERGILFGKVYVDAQCNQLRKNQHWPIGGVKIYLETGDYVITDENGQYSMFGVKPGNHVLRVDKQTLPVGIELQPIDTRNAGDGYSRFVDMLRGEMHRADFSAPCPTQNQTEVYQELQDRNNNVNGEWLLETADNFKGLQYDTQPKVMKQSELESGIVSGPSINGNMGNDVTDSNSVLTVFKGYALESRQGRKQDLESVINIFPENIKTEAYLYPLINDTYSIRFGFSDQQSKLNSLKQALASSNIDTTIVETSYNNIPHQAKFNIDNNIGDDIPLPEKEAKNITRAEAEKGTWYWPKNDYSYDGRFIVVVRGDVEPALYVNGDKVSNTQLGERIVNKRENAQIMGWYGVGLPLAENLIEVKAADPFGNERVILSKNFSQPQSAKHINLMADGDVLRADGGRSVMPIIIRLYDENDKLSRGTYFVTLDTNKGDIWLDPDIQEQESGHQVRVINGEKTVYLRSTETTGEITVRASVEDFSDEMKLYQVAADRPLFVTGILNYTGRYGSVSGEEPSQQADNYRDGHYTDDERAAIFIKGNIKGGMHLTLSYDSDKSDEEFLREISPDSYYPLPGDASIKGYDARSTSKIYAKLEKDRHYIMWGDYSTADGSDNADIGRTSQILNGVSGMYNDGRLTAQLYGARPEDLHKVTEFDGNGTAMFYNIGDDRIVRHTDIVTLLTYDRNSPGLIINQQPLIRYVDYTIDYFTGDMRFNRVIPSYDPELNPIKVRVAYDVDGNGDKYTIAGTRLSYLFTPYLAAGASYEHNSHDVEGYNIGSLWVNYDFDSKTKLVASVATMNHEGNASATTVTDTTNNTGKKIKKGSAVKFLLKRDWTARAATELEYVYAQEGFTNTTGGVTPARQEVRLRHRHKLTGIANLNIEANHSESLVYDEMQQSISATIDTKILGSQWMTRIGSRYIHNKVDNNSEEYTTAIIGLGRSFSLFSRPARFDTEYEQSFGHNSKRRFNIKADWNIHKQASIYTQYEYIDSLSGISNLGSGSTNMFTAGIDVDWLNGGSTYSEFRQRGASDGRSLELANGYRGRFEVVPGISIDPSVEYVEVLKGDSASGVAVSLGLADIRNPNYKTTGRVEYRHGDNEDYYGLLGAWVTRLSQDWSGLVRDEYRYMDKDQGANTWSNHMSLGVAYRPRLNNRYHMLAAYEWKTEHSEISRDAHILSTHQNYQLSPKWTVSGRVGMKWEDFTEYQQDYDTVSTIIDGRVIYYINRRWDVDLHAGILGTDWFNSRRYSAGAGVNYLIMKNLRAGIGYNVIGFDDDDLDPQGYNLQGFYFDLMFKLDEDMFDWLSD